MAAGGLTKFIHGTQQGTKANPRKIPQKLILDDANQVYKYSSAEVRLYVLQFGSADET